MPTVKSASNIFNDAAKVVRILLVLVLLQACAATPAHPVFRPDYAGGYGERTVYFAVTSEPQGADVYTATMVSVNPPRWNLGSHIGTTPFDVPVVIDRQAQATITKPSLLGEGGYSTVGPGEDSVPQFNLVFKKDGYYDVCLNQLFYGAGSLAAGYRASLNGCPLPLIERGRSFADVFANAMAKEDFFRAEELRLRRIDDLKSALTSHRNFQDRLRNGAATGVDSITSQIIESEIDQLQHTVGLLDPQLMALRKQLLLQLRQGSVDTALDLTQAIARMEERYFPKPQPQPPTIIVQAPGTNNAGAQEVVVQQKPYYGVANIAEALINMRAGKVDPERAQRAFGAAQLLDVLGGLGGARR